MCKISIGMCLCDIGRIRQKERERAQKIIEEMPVYTRNHKEAEREAFHDCKEYEALEDFKENILDWKQEALKKLNSNS